MPTVSVVPSQELLARFALTSDLSWNQIVAIVDTKIAIARQQIDLLAKAKTLRARGKDVDKILNALTALQKHQSKKAPLRAPFS